MHHPTDASLLAGKDLTDASPLAVHHLIDASIRPLVCQDALNGQPPIIGTYWGRYALKGILVAYMMPFRGLGRCGINAYLYARHTMPHSSLGGIAHTLGCCLRWMLPVMDVACARCEETNLSFQTTIIMLVKFNCITTIVMDSCNYVMWLSNCTLCGSNFFWKWLSLGLFSPVSEWLSQ